MRLGIWRGMRISYVVSGLRSIVGSGVLGRFDELSDTQIVAFLSGAHNARNTWL